ncbi:MAG TPA: hypothetical protein VN636_18305, partial [Acidimicrobiia bacterium]|nr:hypothetical protein [Acidimicrobiia bacterium]
MLRTAATACAIGAAAALGLALASASDPFAAASTVDRASTLRTPVWSPRRVPLVFGPAAARAEQARAAAADAALTTR